MKRITRMAAATLPFWWFILWAAPHYRLTGNATTIGPFATQEACEQVVRYGIGQHPQVISGCFDSTAQSIPSFPSIPQDQLNGSPDMHMNNQ